MIVGFKHKGPERFFQKGSKAGISPEMAIRLSIAFNTTPESWLSQQVYYDLWRAEQRRDKLNVKRLAAPVHTKPAA